MLKDWKRGNIHATDQYGNMNVEAGASLPIPLEKPQQRRLIMNDTTTEAVCKMLAGNPRGMLLHVDEAMGWIAGFDCYRNGGTGKDQAFWLQADGGGSYAKDRANSDNSIFVPNLSVSVIGGIQQSKLRQVAPALTSDGFIQRAFVIEAAEVPNDVDREPDHAATAAYEALVQRLLDLRPGPTIMLDWDAHEWREDVNQIAAAMKVLPSSPEPLRQHMGKWAGRFARLALTFHMIEGGGPWISRETAQRVRDFMVKYLLPQQRRFYATFFRDADDVDADPRWIAGHILASKANQITMREIKKFYHAAEQNEVRIEAAMERLDRQGWVGATQYDRSKRSTYWNVNPEVHRRFATQAVAEKKRRDEIKQQIADAVERVRSAA